MELVIVVSFKMNYATSMEQWLRASHYFDRWPILFGCLSSWGDTIDRMGFMFYIQKKERIMHVCRKYMAQI